MASETLELFLTLLPKIPLMVRISILHVLQISEQSNYLDLRSELTVAVIRSLLSPSVPRTITDTQKLVNRDPGIRGRIWISKVASPPPPETSVRDVLLRTIRSLQHAKTKGASVRTPEMVPVEAEWTGYRNGVSSDAKLPEMSEAERYRNMMKEVRKPTTVLYLHGGAYYLMDPATHRPTTKKIAKLTGGRCYSVRYRLSPQHAFPAALLDALCAYLTLLYPPPGSFHQPVKPEQIVFSGDSAGGNLCLALLQTVLQLRRLNLPITWFGTTIPSLPLPAGIALSSPWLDLTASSPSWEQNSAYDYLPTPTTTIRSAGDRPPCPAWPASPPRKSLYADDAFVIHPLVTLLMAPSWAGSPPVYLCTGWELLADEDRYIAAQFRRDGVKVVFEEYEAMPHCFALMIPHLDGSRRFFDHISGFISRCVEEPKAVESSFTTIKAKTLREVDIDPETLSPMTREEIEGRVWKRVLAAKAKIGETGDDKASVEQRENKGRGVRKVVENPVKL